MDKLKAMHIFVQIADSGSLSAAAKVMDASLPAVVRTLQALEADLGVRLFNRSTRRIALTEEGQQYLQSSRQILGAVASAEAGLHAKLEEPSGLLTLTAPVQLGHGLVTPMVTRFVAKYPKVRCSVHFLDRVVNLLEEGFDLGIRVGELQDSGLVARPIGSVRRVLVASPSYLAHHGVPQHPQDLADANCIRFSGPSGPWWTFADKGKPLNVAVSGNLEFNQASAALEACLAGLGVGMFIASQLEPYLANGQLVALLQDFETAPRPIHVVYPHARLLPSRTRMFIEEMGGGWRG